VNGALGCWGVGAKAKILQLNGIYFPFYWRVKNFHPHVLVATQYFQELKEHLEEYSGEKEILIEMTPVVLL